MERLQNGDRFKFKHAQLSILMVGELVFNQVLSLSEVKHMEGWGIFGRNQFFYSSRVCGGLVAGGARWISPVTGKASDANEL